MKKRFVFLPLVIVVAVSLLFVGCGVNTSSSTSTSASSSTPSTTKVIELKYNSWSPQATELSQAELQGFKMIEEKSKGRIKITPYFDQTLLKTADSYKGLASGVADISKYSVGTTPGVQDLDYVFNLINVGLPNVEKTSKLYRQLLNKFPEIQQENEKKGVRWIDVTATPPTQLHLTKNQVKVPQDLKGKTIITSNAMLTELISSYGGAAVKLGPPDWYTSLQKGIAEGQITFYPAVTQYKTSELFKYHTHIGDGGLGINVFGYMINLKTWKSLPPDLQQIVTDGFVWIDDASIKMNQDLVDSALNDGKKAGQIFYECTPEEINKWAEAAKPVNAKWIKDTEAKGLPAQKIYDGLQQLIKDNK